METKLKVLEVYKTTLRQAQNWKKQAGDMETDSASEELYRALAQELFNVCALLERTEEVNPTTN